MALLTAGLLSAPAHAHGGVPPAPHDIWSAWRVSPSIMIGLAVSTWLYARGVAAIWSSAGRGRVVSVPRFAAFLGAQVTLALALLSPLDALGGALFSAHMVQHVLLMNVAAPLLAWSVSPALMLWALPRPWRLDAARWWRRRQVPRWRWPWLWHPFTAWLLYTATLWLWHAPVLYQAAIVNDDIHVVEHFCMLASALLLWWVLRTRPGSRAVRLESVSILLLFTTALHSGLLAALITLAPRPLYPIYNISTAAWGLTPLADQQLAGAVMWVPVGFLYLGSILWRLLAYLRAVERGEPGTRPYPLHDAHHVGAHRVEGQEQRSG